MKKILLITLLLHICLIANSQKIVTYKYITNKNIDTTNSIPPYTKFQEFSTTRKYIGTSSFTETQLFTGSNSESIFFKIKKGVWYYRARNKWYLFYDYKKKTGGFIGKEKVEFKKVVKLKNETLHQLSIHEIGWHSAHYPRYYFSVSKGVIFIRTGMGVLLIRDDCFRTSLKDSLENDKLNIL
jgi:hypothetical protein